MRRRVHTRTSHQPADAPAPRAAQNLHPHMCVTLDDPIEAAVARVYGSKDVGEYPKPHRLPFYPYLDPRRQRRDLRALKALGLSLPLPDPHPRNPETGKPLEPAPTTEELIEIAKASENEIKDKLTARLTAAKAAMEQVRARWCRE
jgi:hypothetical protein